MASFPFFVINVDSATTMASLALTAAISSFFALKRALGMHGGQQGVVCCRLIISILVDIYIIVIVLLLGILFWHFLSCILIRNIIISGIIIILLFVQWVTVVIEIHEIAS